MKDTYKILRLISKGEAAAVLSEPDLVEKLNELNKYGLIDITDGTVVLSEKGKAVQRLGLEAILKRKTKRDYVHPHRSKNRSRKRLYLLGLGILLLFLLSLLMGLNMISYL